MRISARKKPPVLAPYDPPRGPLVVVHRDDWLLVVDKPAGLLSVPGRGAHLADCLLSRVQAEHPGALLVHRLDRDTSGLILFAMKREAQRHLGLQFERRQVDKRYEAIVAGHPAAAAGQVDLPLIVDWPNRPLHKVCFETGRPARTRWKVVARGRRTTRVALFPLTGRSHQLRVHMAALGHPILGDPFYGTMEAERMMLHATDLELYHPRDGRRVRFHSPPPFPEQLP